MNEIQLIEINKILVAAQAVRLAKREIAGLEMEYKDADTEEDYFNAAYYTAKNRDEKTNSSYPPLWNIKRLAQAAGVTLKSAPVQEREVITTFFCGGI
ncbi:coil containing protein [Vibrio phage 1.166.O._10N.261.51.C7]|nr:coil containing protein [Vibrio phage 1.166.O._10N.261.51.C7]AUR94033.1 coil containing protein [Vibrio phage 1.190.O._10N.286.51.F12]